MAQHKRRRATRYKQHLNSNPTAMSIAKLPEHKRSHRAALNGRSSNAYLRRVGLGI